MLSAFNDGALFGKRHGQAPLRVLALHGWGRTHTDFDLALSPQGSPALDAIALDLPGFGATPVPEFSMSSMDYAQSIAPVLDEASDGVIVVGHSHGGRVAVCLAALRPEKINGLILIGAPVLRRASAAKPSMKYRTLRFLNRLHLLSDQRFEARKNNMGSADYQAAQGVMRETLVRVINESFETELPELSCPVILVWGRDDTDVPLEVAERARLLLQSGKEADVQLVVIDDVGHLVPTKDPKVLRRVLEEMLAK